MPKSIATQLRAIQKKSMATAEKVVKETYFDTFNDTIIASPIDEGLFRANWLAAYDSIDGSLMPIGTNPAGSMVAELARLDIKEERLFYMTNSLPYAYRLENGWSDQAPKGMVKVSAARFESIAQQKINKFR